MLAGGEVEAQLLIGLQEAHVGEAAAMGEQNARRELAPAFVAGEIGVVFKLWQWTRQIVRD